MPGIKKCPQNEGVIGLQNETCINYKTSSSLSLYDRFEHHMDYGVWVPNHWVNSRMHLSATMHDTTRALIP